MNASPNWMPSNIAAYKGQRVQIKLLCGTDTLEKMTSNDPETNNSIPWTPPEVQDILSKYGLVVITRDDIKPRYIIYKSDLLHRFTVG